MSDSKVNNLKGYGERRALPCGLTVLHIDDDPLALELVRDQLVWQQVRVVSASRAGDALRHLTAGLKPDLVLCDIMMPGRDGYSLHEGIRCHPAWRHIPFIYLTALDGDAYYRQGMNHGADGYLSKPFTAHELRQEMLHVLRRVAELRRTDVAITLLGGQSVRLGHSLLPPPDRGAEQLLYYLLTQPATPHGWLAERDRAIGELWGGVSAGGFRSVLSRLRSWLGGWAGVESGATLCLSLAPGVSCDFHALERALEENCHSERLRRLYRGPLLPEYHQEWAATRREGLIVRLKQAFLATRQRAEPRDRALQLRYALEVDPLDQSLWQSYLQLLKQAGLNCEVALARKQCELAFP